jgi:LysR family transcriptional regulator, transcriptional activator for dmlA
VIDSILDLRLFVAIRDHGSIAAAARHAHMTPAAASKRLLAMEAQIGRRLFHRSTRSLTLTADGAALHSHAVAIIDRAEEAHGMLSGADGLVGRLRVTASATFGALYLGAALDAFMREHPRLVIDVDLTDRVVDLVAEGVDVAIRYGNLQDSRLVARRLLEGRQILCASPEYLAERGQPEEPADLAEHDCVSLEANPRWHIARGDEEAVVQMRPKFRSSLGAMVRDLTLRGHGVALLADWLVAGDVARGALVPVLPAWSSHPVALHAVYASREHLPARVRVFIDDLVRHFGDPSYVIGRR